MGFLQELAMPTPCTQMRLDNEDKANIADIQRRYALPTFTSAVRFAVKMVAHGHIVETPKKSKKNPSKGVDSVATDDILRV